MQRKKVTKKNNNRKSTTTAQNKTATLQYKDCQEQTTLQKIGRTFVSITTSTVSTLFQQKSLHDAAKTPNPLLCGTKTKPSENEKTETDLKLIKLHTQLEKVLRPELSAVEGKITEANKNKQPNDTLISQKRSIRAQMDEIRVEKVKLVAELIREHANRRADLFFYLCVLVYKTGVIVSKGDTDRQHGNGNAETGTAACHPCLIPNPVFTPRQGATDTAIKQLPVIIQQLITYFRPVDDTPASQTDTDDLSIRDSFNLTTILPVIVNKFDNLLEGTVKNPSELVLRLLKILNRVSAGEINPLQAMDGFGAAINTYFNGLEKTYTLEPKPDTKNPLSLSLILRYQREGTHRVINKVTGAAYRDHFYMLLGLKQHLSTIEYLGSFALNHPIEKCILGLQQELLDPPLIIDPISPLKAEVLASLQGIDARFKIAGIYESYETIARLLLEKINIGKETDDDKNSVKNITQNMRLLDDASSRLPKKDMRALKKDAEKVYINLLPAEEALKNKLGLCTDSQLKPSLN